MECKECKFSARKGWFCTKRRKKTTPYHISCEEGEMEDNATPELPKILDIETNLIYILMRSTEYLMYDIDRRLRVYRNFFSIKKKKQINGILASVSKTKELFDTLEKDYSNNLNAEEYDIMMRDAFECIRLMMLYADKCGSSEDNRNKVFSFIRSLKGEDLISEEDISRFYIKK